jgi:flagella basal body P-ring formation protein FlgA
MIRSIIRTFILLVPFAAPLTAAAQTVVPAPALRASVTVAADVVRIGDLVENAGPVADVPIFRSPDLGTTGAVSTQSIVDAIRPHQLIDIDTRGLAEVAVTRAGRAITAHEITASIAQALAGQYGFGDAADISISFDRDVRTLYVEPNATAELHALALSYDPHTARFDVTLDLRSSAILHRQPARYTGTAIETVATVAVDHPVEHGEVLKASDLTILRRPKSETGFLADVADAVGLAARHQLRPDQPLRAADLMKPEIVQRNDTVTIVYEAPGLVLTLRGQAQEAGALGDSIGVLNADSKRVIQGIVTAPGRVTVSAVATRLVQNIPAAMVVTPSAPERSE